MAKRHSHAVTPEELMAYVDGEISVDAVAGIDDCAECSATVADYGRLQARLRQTLYRFDCPSAHLLGEYALDLANTVERTAVAAHVLECDECTSELEGLRAYLAFEPPTVQRAGLRASMRRIVAQLVSGPPAGALALAFRDIDPAAVMVYQTDTVQISVTQTPGARPGSACLIGLVLLRSDTFDALADSEVSLVPAVGSPLTSWTDKLGNFSYEELDPGTYRLELALPDEVVVVGELQLLEP
jgi:hypothetical protein